MEHAPSPDRYDRMRYRRCGASGLRLPEISLGLWHNFGGGDDFETMRRMVLAAFDRGVTHFDLANNYGPPPGSAEENFGRILATDLRAHRDELVVSTKAGYGMWPGPYGDHGSRKYLLASLDQSLRRLGLEYVDVFYHHRPDPDTPLEETMGALDTIVRSGRALYVGLSNYRPAEAAEAIRILRELGTPCLIHQPRYNLLDRWIEDGLTDVLRREKVGCIVFSPLARGVLTGKYLSGIPVDSRIARDPRYLKADALTDALQRKVAALKAVADARGQKLHQMALQWVLRDPVVTSALIGVSRPEQIADNLQALSAAPFSAEELSAIEEALQA